MMDKKAQEGVYEYLLLHFREGDCPCVECRGNLVRKAGEILFLIGKLGYRKLSEDKPPDNKLGKIEELWQERKP